MQSDHRVLLISLLLASIASGATARAEDPLCSGAEVRHVRVPLDYDRPDSGGFDLAYRVREASLPGRATIIVIPGGPGATPIEDDPNVRIGAIPADYGVLLTDPRGAGCNDEPRLSDRQFNSVVLARDILSIVSARQLEAGGAGAGYVLYGQSYGTIVATIAASLATALPVARPRALVLEGTLGHSFSSYNDYFRSFQTEWRLLRDGLSSAWQAAFRDARFPQPLPGETAAWAYFVENDLLAGYRPDGDHVLDWQLSPSGRMALLAGVGYFAGAARRLAGSDAPPIGRLARAISCRELFGEFYPLRDLDNGEIVLAGQNACSVGERLSRPFDASDWPLAVPLVYVQGGHDPATPPAQARYHFDHQPFAPRYFVSVDLAAHAVLGITLDVGDCPAVLWDSITSDLDRLAAAVARCDRLEARARVQLEYMAADHSAAIANNFVLQ